MAEFRMPSLGADMEVGTLIQWLVKPGDVVKRGDIIAVVDTEKAAIEIEVFQTGVIHTILVHVGETVPVGAVLALILTDGEPLAAGAPAEVKPKPAPPPEAVAEPAPPPPPAPPHIEKPAPPKTPQVPSGRLRISPLAMRAAVELGVDLATVQGTGPDGAITKADVERAASKAAPAVAPAVTPAAAAPVVKPAEVVPPVKPAIVPADRQAAMRKAIAAAMSRSKREIPHYYLGTHIAMSRALAWLQVENLKRPVTERLLYSVLLLKVVVLRVLGDIAPEAELEQIDPVVDLREQLDLDSMDILNLRIGIHEATGVDIPEADYPQMANLNGCVAYLRPCIKGA